MHRILILRENLSKKIAAAMADIRGGLNIDRALPTEFQEQFALAALHPSTNVVKRAVRILNRLRFVFVCGRLATVHKPVRIPSRLIAQIFGLRV